MNKSLEIELESLNLLIETQKAEISKLQECVYNNECKKWKLKCKADPTLNECSSHKNKEGPYICRECSDYYCFSCVNEFEPAECWPCPMYVCDYCINK